jgi:hypothetical protein
MTSTDERDNSPDEIPMWVLVLSFIFFVVGLLFIARSIFLVIRWLTSKSNDASFDGSDRMSGRVGPYSDGNRGCSGGIGSII